MILEWPWPGSHRRELTPENMELLASYSCPGGAAGLAPGDDLGDVRSS